MTLAEQLRTVPVFADLPPDDLEWLASQMTEVVYAPGDFVFAEGSPADRMFVVLEGEIRAQPGNPSTPVWVVRAPDVTGMLPYSRMTHFPLAARVVTPSRAATYPADRFRELLERLPILRARLIGVLTDRVRRATQMQDQTEKMAALGKISAGLAHELNNPAAAARRAVGSLREAFQTFRTAAARLDQHPLSAEQRAAVPAVERELAERAAATANLDSLERSDCEEAVARCLVRHGVTRAWELAPALVDAGCEAAWFDRLTSQFPAEVLGDLLARITASLTICTLLTEIEKFERTHFRAGARDQRIYLHGPGARAGDRHSPWH
jgi:CRP-like cAMP-binding protein